VTKLDKKYHQI